MPTRFYFLSACFSLLLGASGNAPAQIYGGIDTDGSPVLSNFPSHATRNVIVAGSSAVGHDATPRHLAAHADVAIPAAFKPILLKVAHQFRLDPALLHAVITVESGYNPKAVSPRGARGLMQLMPGTARRFGVQDAFDPHQNVEGGARYLRWLLDRFDGDLVLALAGYNAGEQAVIQAGNRVPPFNETRAYVPRVLARYRAQIVIRD